MASCDEALLHSGVQDKIMKGIVARYEKEMGIINKIVQESSTGIEFLMPQSNNEMQAKAPQQMSVIDSPPPQKKTISKSESKAII